MKRLVPLIALVALAALSVCEAGMLASAERPATTYPDLGYDAGGASMTLEGLVFTTMRPVALRPARTRTEIPSNELAQNVEPAPSRRLAWRMEFISGGLSQSPEGLEWSLTAMHRARAELRIARGRQSDP